MNEFNLCDIVIVTAEHPIGLKTITKGEIGIVAEIGRTGSSRCYRVQNVSRNRKNGFFYAPTEIRKATDQEIRDELTRFMIADQEEYSEQCN